MMVDPQSPFELIGHFSSSVKERTLARVDIQETIG